VDYLSLEWSDADNLERLRNSAHSRFPLCEVGLDSIVGFVHARDVLERALDGPVLDLKALAREAPFVPDTMPLSTFITELQTHQAHCAAVVDERGTVIGLAFREDALEEIVGPLGDEEEQRAGVQALPDGSFEVGGLVSLPEVCDRLDIELGDEEYEDEDTIGGHVTARLGRLPRRGDEVRFGPYRARVIDVGRRRVQRIRLEPVPEAEGGAPSSGGGPLA
jgi:CBS domain containing-hemolysin-like protein